MTPKNLVIVESPAKAKTIERYLGSDYKVLASFGHIRDLPSKKLGVDVKNDFRPDYVVPTKARKTVQNLKRAAKGVETVFLATDYDREGEAIAWHILAAMGLGGKNKKIGVKRITFHEITKSALESAINDPRKIDMDLVDAQQARRVLDRLVGYKLSPFLWRKIMKGLSAGRVQSVTVRIIVDREREIEAFKPEEYWEIVGNFEEGKTILPANLVQFEAKRVAKLTLKDKETVLKIKEKLEKDSYTVEEIKERQISRSPYAPFTTSTLQQEASKKLYFSSKQTMRLAQQLYEDGKITYMRTDSTQIAKEAQMSAREYIKTEFGGEYLPKNLPIYKQKSKGAQEAHEAIRPSKATLLPDQLPANWSERHIKLYRLIWQRFIASQMEKAVIKRVSVSIGGKENNSRFTVSGQQQVFNGFLSVYPVKMEEVILPELKKNQKIDLRQIETSQHFTQPPARFNEASLVKTLEELGIGRPSTYAPTIATIIDRGYVRRENRVFFPEEIGLKVTDILKEHFPNIVSTDFTANMENGLDKIADGKEGWTEVISEFWNPFNKNLEKKIEEVPRQNMVKELDEKCPECQSRLVERLGKYGPFIACSGFPDCKYSRQIVNDSQVECPECKKGTLIERRTRKGGRKFWGCSRYPKCKQATWNDPTVKEKEDGESAQ